MDGLRLMAFWFSAGSAIGMVAVTLFGGVNIAPNAGSIILAIIIWLGWALPAIYLWFDSQRRKD